MPHFTRYESVLSLSIQEKSPCHQSLRQGDFLFVFFFSYFPFRKFSILFYSFFFFLFLFVNFFFFFFFLLLLLIAAYLLYTFHCAQLFD